MRVEGKKKSFCFLGNKTQKPITIIKNIPSKFSLLQNNYFLKGLSNNAVSFFKKKKLSFNAVVKEIKDYISLKMKNWLKSNSFQNLAYLLINTINISKNMTFTLSYNFTALIFASFIFLLPHHVKLYK